MNHASAVANVFGGMLEADVDVLSAAVAGDGAFGDDDRGAVVLQNGGRLCLGKVELSEEHAEVSDFDDAGGDGCGYERRV